MSNTYASSAAYSAASELTALTHQLTSSGTTYTRAIGYNTRLQPTSIEAKIGSTDIQHLQINFPSGSNNGNMSSITNSLNSTRNQTFTYDNLNRLSQAYDASHWGENYVYDNWGNMYQRNRMSGYSGGGNWTVTSDPYNHLSNLSYDSAGEVTSDQFGNSFTYDAEGRMSTGGGGTYVYDGAGNRVKKTASSTTTLYWADSGTVLNESNSGATSFGRMVYLAGQMVWREDTAGTGVFLFQDHLGSTRVTASAGGTVKDDIDYLPFGDLYNNYGTSASDNHYLFTGDESDASENSTSYATYRNLSTSMARFHRPDPYDGSYDAGDPQSLNRYSYVANRPMANTDTTGLMEDNSGYCPPWFAVCEPDGGGGVYIGGGGDGGGGGGGNNTGSQDGNDVAVETTGSRAWNDPWNEHLGLKRGVPLGGGGFAGILGLPTGGCEFGVCSFQNGGNATIAGDATTWLVGYLDNALSPLIFTKGNRSTTPYRYFGTHHCGPGGDGQPVSALDIACQIHDRCYARAGINADGNTNSNIPWTAGQVSDAFQCNQALYRAAQMNPTVTGSKALQLWLTWGEQFGYLRKHTSAVE